MFQTPILFLIFNRPDTTKIVFDRIKELKPKYLYVAADGARKNREGEEALCKQTRAIIKIDWNCEVKTLFRNENLGCGTAVSEAITWFFNEVEQGIIIEDDCLPDVTFFFYCEILLEYYKNNNRIMHIGGTNSQFGNKRGDGSYYFSKYPHIWGWATWKRAWSYYKYSFTKREEEKLNNAITYYSLNKKEIEYWKSNWSVLNSHDKIDTWDIQWTFSCWFNEGITIVPNKNLVSNIGFNKNATHTKEDSKLANLPTETITNIIHPKKILINKEADLFTFNKYNLLSIPFTSKIRNWISHKTPKTVKDIVKKIIR